MPVNPYSTPIKLEYKPLGLEAFAKPLSAIREKFETAQDKVDQTEFELSRLAKDDERAKAMLEEVLSARDELAQNLATTGNYRQATQKLLKMNKQFNKGEETVAIKSNYDNYQKALEEQKERVKSGKITPEDFEMWKFNTTAGFKGTNFDPKSKEYNPINTAAYSDNLQKEMEEKSLELARMTVADRTVAFKSLGMSDAYTEEFLKTTTETKDINRLSREIKGFLANSERYKDFVDHRAQEEFKYNEFKDPGFAQKYTESLLNTNAQTIAAYEQALKDPNITSEQKQTYANGLTNYQKAQEGLMSGLQTAATQGNLRTYAENLYKQEKRGVFDNLANRSADLVDYTFVNQDKSSVTNTAAKEKGEEVDKKIKEVGAININAAATVGDAKTMVTSGQSTSTESALIKNKKNAYEQINSTPLDKTPGLESINVNLTAQQLGGIENKKEYDSLLTTSRDLYVVQNRMWQMNETEKNLDAQIETKKRELNKASNQDVRDGVTEELNQLFLDKQELKIARTDDTKTLDLIIESKLENAPASVKELYNKTYNKDPYVFFEALRTAVNNDAKTAAVKQAESENLQKQLNQNPALIKDQTGELQVVTPRIEDPLGSTLKVKDPLTSFAMGVMDSYLENIKSSYLAIGVEVAADERSDALTNGALKRTIEYAFNNQQGNSEVKKVALNTLTGETKEDPNGNNYDLNYYSETPHYAGVDQNSSVILKYSRKPGIKPSAKSSGIQSNLNIVTEPGKPFVATDAQLADWDKNNPENLYVAVKGRTNDIVNSAQDNYQDMMSHGLLIGGEDGFAITQQSVQNYAPIHVLSDNRRRELYFEMAARIKDAADNNHKFTNLTQAPAAWNKNEDGTYTGFMINYQVDKGDVVGIVSKIVMNPDRSFRAPEVVKAVHLNQADKMQNLTSALAAMDLMYGTGREEDLVEDTFGRAFVPAFKMNPSFNTISIKEGF